MAENAPVSPPKAQPPSYDANKLYAVADRYLAQPDNGPLGYDPNKLYERAQQYLEETQPQRRLGYNPLALLQKAEAILAAARPQDALAGRKISRRHFLGLAAGVGAAAVAEKVLIDPTARPTLQETKTALEANVARKGPLSTEDKFEQLTDGALERTYERYFTGKEHLFSKRAWMRRDKEGPQGFGLWIARLANFYYDGEKQPGETFDSYFERFMEKLRTTSDVAKLDFIVLTTSLKATAENIGDLEQYKSDTGLVQAVQMPLLSIARHIGKQTEFVEAFESQGFVQTKLVPLAEKLRLAKPKEEWDIKSVFRIPSEITTGMMDFEPSMRARALLLHGSDEMKQLFRQQHPDIVQNYQDILVHLGIDFKPLIGGKENRPQETIASSRMRIEQVSKAYIDQFATRLDVFLHDDNALAAIGIKVPVDPWQKQHRTDILYELMRRRNVNQDERLNEPGAVASVKEMMLGFYNHDRQGYYRYILSQQILNPKFIAYIAEQAKRDNNHSELEQLHKIQDAIKVFNEQVKLTRTAAMQAVIHEGPLEFNSHFQTLASAMTTKMLSDLSGPFDPNDKNSLYWHVYRMLAIRELSHPFTMARDANFADTVLVDPPYAMQKTLEYLDRFEQLLLEKKILGLPAWQDVQAMDRAIQSIRYNDFSAYPHLSKEDKQELYEFCKLHIIGGEFPREGEEVAIDRGRHLLGTVG